MKIAFSFADKFGVNTFPDSFDFKEGMIINDEYYEKIKSPTGFELGFYNFLINDDKLTGINFQFNESRTDINDFFINNKFLEVNFTNDELFVFFTNVVDYIVDYSQEFLDFYLLKSKTGQLAFTIRIIENFDYELPSSLKPV